MAATYKESGNIFQKQKESRSFGACNKKVKDLFGPLSG